VNVVWSIIVDEKVKVMTTAYKIICAFLSINSIFVPPPPLSILALFLFHHPSPTLLPPRYESNKHEPPKLGVVRDHSARAMHEGY